MTCETAQRAIALAALATAPLNAESDHPDYREPGTPGSPPDAAPLLHETPELHEINTHQTSPEEEWTSAVVRELPKAEREALEDHLNTCRACRAEMTATVAFFRALGEDAGPEPSPSLLARARMQLDETLDSSGKADFWTRLTQQVAFTAGRLRAAPVLSSALLLAGVIAGGYGGYHAGAKAHMQEQQTLLLAPPSTQAPSSVVADVSSVRHEPGTNLVEVQYDRLVPDMLTAPSDDPSIRELLIAGAQTGVDANVRNYAVSLLGRPCSAGSICAEDAPVRNALLNALVNDKAPEVRRAALVGLQPYIDRDMQVRDAVLGSLLSDASAQVRMQAVHMLEPVDVDSSVRQALHTVAAEDGDPTIRSASQAALKTMPQVQ